MKRSLACRTRGDNYRTKGGWKRDGTNERASAWLEISSREKKGGRKKTKERKARRAEENESSRSRQALCEASYTITQPLTQPFPRCHLSHLRRETHDIPHIRKYTSQPPPCLRRLIQLPSSLRPSLSLFLILPSVLPTFRIAFDAICCIVSFSASLNLILLDCRLVSPQ